jgi:ComF family protein
VDILYPPHCLLCGKFDTAPVCEACFAGFIPVGRPFCARCGKPEVTNYCSTCVAAEQEAGWQWEICRSAGEYDGTLSTAIQRFKYNGVDLLAEPLGNFMVAQLNRVELFDTAIRDRVDLVVPVPLHISRLRQRGFNQAELLARSVGRAWYRPVEVRGLRRNRRTKQQANLSGAERRQNMAGSVFEVEDATVFAGKEVVLIDDVFTTGSTLNACAAALRAAGATRVNCVTLAVGS